VFKVAWRPNYVLPLPDGHRFPMEKYELLPQQLLYEGTLEEHNFFAPNKISEAAILRAHNKEYWQRLKTLQLDKAAIRRSGFPLTLELIEREQQIAQGTLDCAHFALKHGAAMNIAGGTHHAGIDFAEGFCLLNDIAIAALDLLHNSTVERILIVDLDVHQGNGTAQILANEPRAFTLSVHGANNFPHRKESSDLDIGLADGCSDHKYLSIVADTIPVLVEKIRPQIIFYQSGVDVLASDKLGRLSLSLEACKERDRIVLETAKHNDIAVCASMGGGYSPEIKHIIEAHANTFRLAKRVFY